MVLALDNAGGGGPVVVDSAPAAMKMSELMSEIIDSADRLAMHQRANSSNSSIV